MALTNNEKIRIIALQLGIDTSEVDEGIDKLANSSGKKISEISSQIVRFFDAMSKEATANGTKISDKIVDSIAKGLKADGSVISGSLSELFSKALSDAGLGKWNYDIKTATLKTFSGQNFRADPIKGINMSTFMKQMSGSISPSVEAKFRQAISQPQQKAPTTPTTPQTPTTPNALDNSVQNLNTTVNNLNTTIQGLDPQLQNLSSAVGTMATANTNINNATQQLDQAATRLAQAGGEISSSAHLLSTAINSANNAPTSSGGSGSGGSNNDNTPRTSQDSRARIKEFDRDTSEGFKLIADTSQKGNATIINAQKIFEKFKGNYGHLIRNILETFDDKGVLTRINATLRLSSKQSARISLTPDDMQAIMNEHGNLPTSANNRALKDMMMARGGISSTSRVLVDEVSQVERYKSLLKEQWDLQLKLYEAEQNQDTLLQNEIKYKLQINQIEKEMVNRSRDVGGRQRFDENYGVKTNKKTGNILPMSKQDPESIYTLNQQLQSKNELMRQAVDERNQEDNLAREQVRLEQELINLVSERTRLQSKLSGLTTSSKGYTDTQARLSQVNTAIEGYRGRVADDRYNTLTSSDLTQQQQNIMSKLTRLETERFQAWQKSRSAMKKGNTEEAAEYQKIAQARLSEYNSELRSANGMSLINNELRGLLDRYVEYNQTLQSIDNAKSKDVQRQKQETDTYKTATSALNDYVALLKEKSSLKLKEGSSLGKGVSNTSVYGAAYQNVVSKIGKATGKDGFGNLIDIDASGDSPTVKLKEFNNTLGITKDQYEQLRKIVAETNQTIKDNTVKANQEQDLKHLNDMITAYTNLKKAQSTLQEYKARAYNDATINQQQNIVDKLQQEYNTLLATNPELAKNSTYTQMLADANKKLSETTTRASQNTSKQLTLLERLKASLQRTASVAFSFNIFNRLFMEMRQGLTDVISKTKEFDEAMTNIQLVTNQTDTSVKKTLASYSELAKQLGTTTENVAEG